MATKSKVRTVDAFPLTRQPRSKRLAPRRLLADLVSKRWMEGAIPIVMGLLLSAFIVATTPGFGGSGNRSLILRELSEKGLVAVGLTVVLIAGGIDLSVGSIVGVAAIGSLTALRAWNWPVPLIIIASLAAGMILGAVNGVLIAKIKTRPFITTLVTLLTFRTVVQAIQTHYRNQLAFPKSNTMWDFLGNGSIAGIRTSLFIFIVVLILGHLVITRARWGWWVTAVGSDRRSARRNGIPVDRVVFATYVVSGLLAGVAGLLISARQGSTSDQVGAGYEIAALTAVVLGGVSLRGGRGSAIRAAVGMFVVAIISRATEIRGKPDEFNQAALAVVLLSFAILDLKWGKYRNRIAEKLQLDPGSVGVDPLVDVTQPGTVWTINRVLTDAEPIGLGQIEGAEDCALDDEGNLFCGDRRGWIWRFRAGEPTGEVFARTGGLPLGHAWDLEGNLLVAVGGMGVYRILPDGQTVLVANQTKRRRLSLHDDSAIRFADDLDITPDGAIFCSDFSTRINAADYQLELVEYRPNGRIVRIDPDGSTDVVVDNHVFPNGICTSHDGQSVLIASTGLFRVDRLWVSGPKQGQLEPVLENMPGYPDNINRASDGNYWMSFVAMRTPVSDLFLRWPAVRRRMTKELPPDDWIVPQLNVSCVIKFDEAGTVLKVWWDSTLENYPMVTSINEHDGYLYLCGLQNNRIGKLALDPGELGPIDPRVVPGAATQARPFSAGRTPAHVS
jgi:ribose transport system permease protein